MGVLIANSSFSAAIFIDYILQDMWCGCWGICGIGTGWTYPGG